MDRRGFLKTVGATIAGLCLPFGKAKAVAEPIAPEGPLRIGIIGDIHYGDQVEGLSLNDDCSFFPSDGDDIDFDWDPCAVQVHDDPVICEGLIDLHLAFHKRLLEDNNG